MGAKEIFVIILSSIFFLSLISIMGKWK